MGKVFIAAPIVILENARTPDRFFKIPLKLDGTISSAEISAIQVRVSEGIALDRFSAKSRATSSITRMTNSARLSGGDRLYIFAKLLSFSVYHRSYEERQEIANVSVLNLLGHPIASQFR
jgi:hypothetical protein